jgi:uncharacterized protein (DUF302 family)
MRSETSTSTFSTPEAFADALRSVRLALDARGLHVLSELDVASRVKQTLGIHLPPCKILYVWPNPSLAMNVYPAMAVVLPLHVVVASRGRQTDICVLSRVQPETANADDFLREMIVGIQTEIMQSLEAISMRPSMV